MNRVLIITYYWPPSGGAGVQRWLKFTKYLRNYGWEPIIYTPENPEAPAIDPSLEKDIPEGVQVIKTRIWEPYSAYKRFVGRKKENSIKAGFLAEKKNPGLIEKIAVWIRGNFFIPDARKFWIKPSVRFLINYLNENPVDVIVSTGPPHSMHLIAMGIKKKLNIPWIADFRDPWTNIDFYDRLMLTRSSDKKHHMLELNVLNQADKIVVVSPTMILDFDKLVHREYHVITNGFDEDEGSKVETLLDKKFSISHIGSVVETRNPEVFWKAVGELLHENPELKNDLEIHFVGPVDYSVDESITKNKLADYISKISYLPHDEIAALQRKSQVLLLLINKTQNSKSVVTGKLFEYLYSGRPILCIGPPDGDAASILKETGSGLVSGYNDLMQLKENIKSYYVAYKKGKLITEIKDLGKYTRKNLTKQFVKLLNELS
jgi:glycosyltransferase involved in cell wall biosynthesis